jgi:hypothetical protein
MGVYPNIRLSKRHLPFFKEFVMSTVFSPTPESLGLTPSSLASKAGAYRVRRRFDGARGLAAMLLAAVVAAIVVVADRLISTWADGHLFLAWVFLWVVIFAGSALFAGTARRLAHSTMRSLDGWSQTLAQARAEARLWDLAQNDPRLMADLTQARLRALEDHNDFSDALAPMGLDTAVTPVKVAGWDAFIERMAISRTRNMHLHYI